MKKYISFAFMLIMIFCLSNISFASDENAQAILNKTVSIVYNNELMVQRYILLHTKEQLIYQLELFQHYLVFLLNGTEKKE